MDGLNREIFPGFWKIHVLHHAAQGPVVGQWMLHELRKHGYDVSPGTLYPLLARMEERGWLHCLVDPNGGPRARKDYYLTETGRRALARIKRQIEELSAEVMPVAAPDCAPWSGEAEAAASRRSPPYKLPPTGVVLRDVERDLVRQALDLTAGNQTRAARLLGINRDALRYRMQKFGLLYGENSRI